jgi:hypothetical protein
MLYVPDEYADNPLTATVWRHDSDKRSIRGVGTASSHARSAPNTQEASLGIASPDLTGIEVSSAFFTIDEEPGVTKAVFAFDTVGTDYFVVISGPAQALRDLDPILEEIIASVRYGAAGGGN